MTGPLRVTEDGAALGRIAEAICSGPPESRFEHLAQLAKAWDEGYKAGERDQWADEQARAASGGRAGLDEEAFTVNPYVVETVDTPRPGAGSRAARRGCPCLCHESGPPDLHMGGGEKCPCKNTVRDFLTGVCRAGFHDRCQGGYIQTCTCTCHQKVVSNPELWV